MGALAFADRHADMNRAGLNTYIRRAARPGWMRADQHHYWQCICRRRPYDDRHSQLTGRASVASLRLEKREKRLQVNKGPSKK